MLSLTNKPFMLNVFILNVIMLSVVAPALWVNEKYLFHMILILIVVYFFNNDITDSLKWLFSYKGVSYTQFPRIQLLYFSITHLMGFTS